MIRIIEMQELDGYQFLNTTTHKQLDKEFRVYLILGKARRKAWLVGIKINY
ncbi:MAG TPA: hypothetical protein VGB16_00670 [candidate division Zixibacteria bacterium]